jgi:fructose-bisphosphate aldolase, class II
LRHVQALNDDLMGERPSDLWRPNMDAELRGVLSAAQAKGAAIGHFNISDVAILKGVVGAAQDMQTAVIVGVSEGERTYLGTRQIAAVIRSLDDEIDVPVFLNADHTHSLASALEAAKAGFDSIVFDLSSLPFEENVEQTRQAVEALKSINSTIFVERGDRRHWDRVGDPRDGVGDGRAHNR